jgi:hypothetical protein
VTVELNWFVALVFRLTVEGLTATEVMLAGTVTLMEEEADLVVSCVLVAVTTSLPPEEGAVYSPELVIVPFWAFQVTEEL